MNKRFTFGMAAAILMAVLAAAPAQAVTTAESVEFEAFVGAYSPGPDDELDVGGMIGVRLGYNITDRFNITGELAFASLDGDFSVRFGNEPRRRDVDLDVDVVVTDFSFMWNIRPKKALVATLYAGPGWGFFSADVDVDGLPMLPSRSISINDVDEDSFTMHFGFGFKWDMTEKFYLRFAGRGRWFENRDEDEVDTEFTFGVGWKFGG